MTKMRKSETQKIAVILGEFLQDTRIGTKMKEIRALGNWEELLGRSVARSTKKLFIRDGKLYVYLSSPVVRNELFMIRDDILKKFNDRAGEKLVREIVLK